MLRNILIASMFAFVGSAWADCGEDHAKDARNENQNPTTKLACEGSSCDGKAKHDAQRACEGSACNDKASNADKLASGKSSP